MRKVARGAAAAVLTAADDGIARGCRRSAAKELRKVRESLAKWLLTPEPRNAWKFSFNVYRDDEVKATLTALFGSKCAYCESKYAKTRPMDVEHWRPKGVAKTSIDVEHKPAYWWLAATWENLLPSCIDCNRERRQTDALSGEVVSVGKKDKFPVEGNPCLPVSPEASDDSPEESERPLRLHPCDDNPNLFLDFDTNTAIVRPRTRSGDHSD